MNGRLPLVAWAILIAALGVLVLALVGVPLAAARYMESATRDETAVVERMQGGVTVEQRGLSLLLTPAEMEAVEAREGTVVTTHGDGRSLVRLFDDSTINLEPNTRLELEVMRRPRFDGSEGAPRVRVAASPVGDAPGQLSVGTTWSGMEMTVRSPQARVRVAPESRARLVLEPERTSVHAVEGSVRVTDAQGAGSVELEADRVVDVEAGRLPGRPRSALRDVIANGGFRHDPETEWFVRAQGNPPGSTARTAVDSRWALAMVRRDSEGNPGDIVLEQELGGEDLTGATFLGLTTTFRIDSQSLRAGGERDTEYPYILKLVVERHDGAEHPWEVGFYGVDPTDPEPDRPGDLGFAAVAVPRGQWTTFGTGNLLDASDSAVLITNGRAVTAPGLDAVMRFDRPPRALRRVEVKGSGHDWSTYVDEVGLWMK